MTEFLFRGDAYRTAADSIVVGHTPEGGLIVDRTVFYPTGGGQPGDSGMLEWTGGLLPVATAVKIERGVALIPAEPVPMPPVGSPVRQLLDWNRRYRHMRMHTALHLLSVVVPLPVTGGQIGSERGRLDFDMPEPPDDFLALTGELNRLIQRDLEVSEDWITDAELAENPDLIKTLSVRPPQGQGRIRLVRIGTGPEPIDLQPCGGTHVARTAEVGVVKIDKIEKKGRRNRRISISFVN